MSNPLKTRGALRTLLVTVGLLDLYGWFQTVHLAVAGHYGDAAFWCVGAAGLGYTVIRDWRKTRL